MFRAQIREEISKIVGEGVNFGVEKPENPEYGDYSSNVALVRQPADCKRPREVAEELKNQLLSNRIAKLVGKIDVAGPGFLNFWIKKEALLGALRGKIKFSKKKEKISLDYLDANPTGPVHIGHARSGFLGDVLSNILEFAGYQISREFYVNNAKVNTQICSLGKTALGRGEEYKHSQLLALLKKPEVKRKLAKTKNENMVGFYIASLIQKANEKFLKEKAKIKFDVFFEEESVYVSGLLRNILEKLVKSGSAYEKEGALWLRASRYGDSEDRVLVRSGGEPTYISADIAYHWDRMVKRKFNMIINIFGADHHGYGSRLKAAIEALGLDREAVKIIGVQTARIVSGGKEVKMSKRKGEFIALEELLDAVGLDAARWFFLERSQDTHMDFDLDLAKERSRKNPVYYVQYAHARCSSILRKVGDNSTPISPSSYLKRRGLGGGATFLRLLGNPEELSLIKKILQLPEIIEDIAQDYQVHHLPRYAYKLAQTFTNFYEKHRVVDAKNPDLTAARLFLVRSTLNAVRHTLSLMGIDAPEKM